MNPNTKELIAASKNLLGLVYGIRMEAERKAEDLPPLVPEVFISVAAGEAVARLEKAVCEFEASERITPAISEL